MTRIFISGAAVVDFVFSLDAFPTRAEKYRTDKAAIVGGGCAANAAVAVAKLGGDATLAARLGDDSIGSLIEADLRNAGVNTGAMHFCNNGRSSFSSVLVDAAGERQIVNFRGQDLSEAADWLSIPRDCDAVLCDNRWTPGLIKSLRIAKERGIPGIVDAEDPIDPATLSAASHIAFSRQGIEALTGENDLESALEKASHMFDAWLCATDGENGVYYQQGGGSKHIPSFSVDTKDTLAAGDIWHGAFALRLAEGASESIVIQFANAAAAIKCTRFGGRDGCPTREEVDQFLQTNRGSLQ